MCDVRSSSRRLSLQEQFYSLRIAEGNSIENHLQQINLLVTQLAHLGITTFDEELVGLTSQSLPKTWSMFRQIQKDKGHLPTFPELEGLLLHEELSRTLDSQHDVEEVNFIQTKIQSRNLG